MVSLKGIFYGASLSIVLCLQQATVLAAPPMHSNVAVEAEAAGDKLQLNFKVKFSDDLKINTDAPWKLKVEKVSGIALAGGTHGVYSELNTGLPGFQIEGQLEKDRPLSIQYELMAFTCTRDEKNRVCYRDVHKGTFEWKGSKA